MDGGIGLGKEKAKTGLSLEDLHAKALHDFQVASRAWKDNRQREQDDILFGWGEDDAQWDADVAQARKNQRPARPVLTVNKIPEKIDQVEGDFRKSAPETKARPVDSSSDPEIARILEGVVRNIRYNSRAKTAYTTAFDSVLYCGRGAWRVNIEDSDEEDSFKQELRIRRIPNVLSVRSDPLAKELDGSDRNFCIVSELMPKETYKEEYPDAVLTGFASNEEDDELRWVTDDAIRVAEYWWVERKRADVWKIRQPDGSTSIVTVKPPPEIQVLAHKKTVKKKVRWLVMNGIEVLEGPYEWPGSWIPILEVFGRELYVRGERRTRGMVRNAKVPCQLYNYQTCAITEQVALQPKAPYLMTPNMLGNHKAQWDAASTTNYFYLLYDDPDGTGARPTREPPPMISQAHTAELARLEHDIMSAMGIYQAGLGDSSNERSGSAIMARQREGDVGKFSYMDNFIEGLVLESRILFELIPIVYSEEQVLRIMGTDGKTQMTPVNVSATEADIVQAQTGKPEGMPFSVNRPNGAGYGGYINDLSVGKYDVFVTVGPSYTTEREATASMLWDLVQSVPQIGLQAADLLVRYLDMPGGAELEQRLRPREQEGPDPKAMLEMMKMQLAAREQDRKEFDSKIKAIHDLMLAEAAERGQQVDTFISLVDQLRQDRQMKVQGEPQGPGNGQGMI